MNLFVPTTLRQQLFLPPYFICYYLKKTLHVLITKVNRKKIDYVDDGHFIYDFYNSFISAGYIFS